MDGNAREKIRRSATSQRLVRLIVGGGVSFALFAAAGAGLAAEGSLICRILAAACFAGAAVRLYFACYFSCVLVGINKRGKEWKFAVSETASFECWGRFLAMNVSFRDEAGLTREGRSRFLFGPHEAEAWQNLPLEIAYRDDDERIVVIGAAPENAGR